MVKTNGYYLDSPKYYEDYVGGNKRTGFCHNSYKFNDDGSFYIGTIYNNSQTVKFKKSDFDILTKNKYKVKGAELILTFNYDKEWQHTNFLKIDDKKSIIDDKHIYKFQKFEE